MEILGIVMAFMLSLSFILLLWELKGCLLKAGLPDKGAGLCLVLKAGGQTRELEQTLRAMLWLRRDAAPRAQLVLLDEGMDEKARKLAEKFLEIEPSLRIVTRREAAEECMRRGIDGANK